MYSRQLTLRIDFINYDDSHGLRIEGYLANGEVKLKDLRAYSAGHWIKIKSVNRDQQQELDVDEQPIKSTTFLVNIPKEYLHGKINFKLGDRSLKIKGNQFSGLGQLALTYKVVSSYLIKQRFGKLRIAEYSKSGHLLQEIQHLISILFNLRISYVLRKLRSIKHLKDKFKFLPKAVVIVIESLLTVPYAITLRLAYFCGSSKSSRPIWLISDRPLSAGDNGEVFYRFLKDQNKEQDSYFLISKKSPDYKRLFSLGGLVDFGSFRHKLLLLRSSVVISSQIDIEIYNPFTRHGDRFYNLLRFDFVFLQHGVIRHDLSAWLNRYNRNIKLFITTSQKEKQSILGNNYYYEEGQIITSGLPRYDLLASDPKDKIIVIPTYRNYLLRNNRNSLGARTYIKDFKRTKFFNFYNRFINDQRLISAMRSRGIKGEFFLHPNFISQTNDFVGNEVFKIMTFPYDYNKAFKEGSLLISDYSSVVFDFAFLYKPIIYAHFDAEEFNQGHIYHESKFFNDNRDGFGDICTSLDELVDKTVESISNGFRLDSKYSKRINNFFNHKDHNNSQRVYDAIIEMNRR